MCALSSKPPLAFPLFTAVSRFSPSRCIPGNFPCKTRPHFPIARQAFHRIFRCVHFSTKADLRFVQRQVPLDHSSDLISYPTQKKPPMKKISRRTLPPNAPPEKPAANHSLKSKPESMLIVKKQTARGMLALVQAYHGQGIFTRIFHRQILRSIHHFSGLLAILPPFLG